MRVIMSRLVFNFDMKLGKESENWMHGQKVYNLWAKPALQVHLVPKTESV